MVRQPQSFLDLVVDKNASKGQRQRQGGFNTGVVACADELAADVATDEDTAKEVAASATEKVVYGKGKAKEAAVTTDEVEPEEPEEPDEPVESDRPEPQENGKKPRKKRTLPFNPCAGSPTKKKAAAEILKANRGAQAGKDMRPITIKDAYDVLFIVLTSDSSKALVHGDVFFDSEKFEESLVSKVFLKLVPYDAAEFGVNIGTKVMVGMVVGKVKSKREGAIVVEVGSKDVKTTVLYVLEHALEGEGVMRVKDAQRKFVMFLISFIVLTHVHLANYANRDPKKKRKKGMWKNLENEAATLRGETYTGILSHKREKKLELCNMKHGQVDKVNPMAWKVVLGVPALDTVHMGPESELFQSFGADLQAFLKRPGSHLEMLGLKHLEEEGFGPDVAGLGIFGRKLVVSSEGSANDRIQTMSKTLQVAFKLGRFVNLHSAVFPLTTGKEFEALSLNVRNEHLLVEARKPLGKWRDPNPTPKTWALEANLALTSDSSYIPSLPLGVIWMYTRPLEIRELCDGSKGAICKHMSVFFKVLAHATPYDSRDAVVLATIKEEVHEHMSEKRTDAGIYYNNMGQLGDAPKVMRGRIGEDPKELQKLVKEKVVPGLMREVIDSFMILVPKGGVTLCLGLLEKEGLGEPGTRTNADHLYTQEVQAVAREFKKKVTCLQIKDFSASVFMVDCVSSKPVRKQERKLMWALHTLVHKHTKKLCDRLPDPDLTKNGASLLKAGRYTIKHEKDELIKEAYAVMVVLCRAVLRLHGHYVDKVVAPLDEEGHELSDRARDKLFKEIGKKYLGLPRFGENILRTFNVTLLLQRCIDNDIHPDNCLELKYAVCDMHGGWETAMKYYDTMRHETTTENTSIFRADEAFTSIISKKKDKAEGDSAGDKASLASISDSFAKMAEANTMLVKQLARAPGGPHVVRVF